jgi:hypothetical protein
MSQTKYHPFVPDIEAAPVSRQADTAASPGRVLSDHPPAPSVITGCIFDDAPYSYVPFVCSLAIEVGGIVETGTRPVLKMTPDIAISIGVHQRVHTSSFRSQSTSCHQNVQRVSVY